MGTFSILTRIKDLSLYVPRERQNGTSFVVTNFVISKRSKGTSILPAHSFHVLVVAGGQQLIIGWQSEATIFCKYDSKNIFMSFFDTLHFATFALLNRFMENRGEFSTMTKYIDPS